MWHATRASCLLRASTIICAVMLYTGDDDRLQIILAPPESACRSKSQSVGSPSQDTACTRLDELCRGARVVRVPTCAPPDRDRLESWSAVWPVSLRKRPTEPRVLDTREKARMDSCITLALHYYGSTAPRVDDLSCPFSGAVLVDPDANTVLAVAGPDAASEEECTQIADSTAKSPLQHAPMRLIADLASQGAYWQLTVAQCPEICRHTTLVTVSKGLYCRKLTLRRAIRLSLPKTQARLAGRQLQ